jgi:hypothetical protein
MDPRLTIAGLARNHQSEFTSQKSVQQHTRPFKARTVPQTDAISPLGTSPESIGDQRIPGICDRDRPDNRDIDRSVWIHSGDRHRIRGQPDQLVPIVIIKRIQRETRFRWLWRWDRKGQPKNRDVKVSGRNSNPVGRAWMSNRIRLNFASVRVLV